MSAADVVTQARAAHENVSRARVALDFIARHVDLDDMQREEYTQASIAIGAALADIVEIERTAKLDVETFARAPQSVRVRGANDCTTKAGG